MSKLVTYAGVSQPLGKDYYVFRTATKQARIDQLIKLGDINVDVVGLVKPMTKQEAAEYLNKINFADGCSLRQQAIDQVLKKSAQKK